MKDGALSQAEGQCNLNLHMSSGFNTTCREGSGWKSRGPFSSVNSHYLRAKYEQNKKQTDFSGKICLDSREWRARTAINAFSHLEPLSYIISNPHNDDSSQHIPSICCVLRSHNNPMRQVILLIISIFPDHEKSPRS